MSSNDYTTIIDGWTQVLYVNATDRYGYAYEFLAVRHYDMYKACDYERDEKGRVIGGSAGIFDEYVTLYDDCDDEPESVTVHEYPEWKGELCDAYCEKRMCGWDFGDAAGIIAGMVADALGYELDEFDIDLTGLSEYRNAA